MSALRPTDRDALGRFIPGSHPNRWTEDEDATVRARYPHEDTAAIARDLGRSLRATYSRASELGLKKKDETARFGIARHRPTLAPVGSLRLNPKGYLQCKVAPGRNWCLVHVALWEAKRGPVPAGHVLKFLNGNKADVRIENLACISRRDMLTRVRPQFHPDELVGIDAALRILRHEIYRRSKEAAAR